MVAVFRFCATQGKSSLLTIVSWLTAGHRESTDGHAFVDPILEPGSFSLVLPLRDHLALSVVADNYPEFEHDGSWRLTFLERC